VGYDGSLVKKRGRSLQDKEPGGDGRTKEGLAHGSGNGKGKECGRQRLPNTGAATRPKEKTRRSLGNPGQKAGS